MSAGPIVVGYMTVDVSKCGHTTDEEHHCFHDWRVEWGNLPRSGE